MSEVVKLAFSIAGTVIGAGFATGKELELFFVGNGLSSLLWLATSLFLMAIVSLLFWKQKKEGITSSLYKYLTPIIIGFSAASYSVMLACGGETLWESTSLPQGWGILFTYLLTILIVKTGIKSVYRFNLFATPLLLCSIIGVSFGALLLQVGLFGKQNTPCTNMLSYTGYNLLSVFPFLSSVSKETPKKLGKYAIIIGFFLVALSGILLKSVLNLHSEIISHEAIPMLTIMGILSPYFSYLYTMMLYTAILTTAVNGLYAITKSRNLLSISAPLFGLSFLGFGPLMENLYSFFGYLGIGIIGIILIESIQKSTPTKGL